MYGLGCDPKKCDMFGNVKHISWKKEFPINMLDHVTRSMLVQPFVTHQYFLCHHCASDLLTNKEFLINNVHLGKEGDVASYDESCVCQVGSVLFGFCLKLNVYSKP